MKVMKEMNEMTYKRRKGQVKRVNGGVKGEKEESVKKSSK